jgi:hypothetical protein
MTPWQIARIRQNPANFPVARVKLRRDFAKGWQERLILDVVW